ncbi:MBL fold metallo-hydrolase [Magnetospirillum sp. UT-4]|uniref:MBL fold metallo-hydrolase n=1 Tax=Magnetospirillum sp. UT-4 TaxID=2681467 RepID=UPI00138586A0|nr:MBL fold metallo-hydrolase [Magnetospirillum sp. UT-4]CAA7611334.1 Zn-dependent hydrolase [Magnetospirillum sp. UT-4]
MRISTAWRLAALAVALFAPATALAGPLQVHKVADNVYALVGELSQRSAVNLGNNATFGAVVTAEGVVLIDSGGSRAGAEAIEAALKTVTVKPVIAVVNTGGQDHRWLGNDHFRAKGARLIASARAVADQKARADMQMQAMGMLIGADRLAGTRAVNATETFEARRELVVGGTRLELIPAGHAHTPGDSIVWLPEARIAFAGDIVFTERMLGVLDVSRSKDWLAAFETLAALGPAQVVPGHGRPATLAAARAATADYLAHLRREVAKVLAAGGGMEAAAGIDQAAFLGLAMADQLARRNAMRVFEEMEFE